MLHKTKQLLMSIQVLHSHPYNADPNHTTQFKSVGLIDPPAELTTVPARLEYAFRATQNVDEPWSKENHRSTSIGDRMWIDNELWQVFPVGWGRVDIDVP